MLTLDQHRRKVIFVPDDGGKVQEIPVLYWDGSFWDDEGREYAFPETKAAYWDNYFRGEQVKRITVESVNPDGSLKEWKDRQGHKHQMSEYKFVPANATEEIEAALSRVQMNISFEDM